jgi:hypothetical protein
MKDCRFCASHDNMGLHSYAPYNNKLKQGLTEVECESCGDSFIYEKKNDKVTETRLER